MKYKENVEMAAQVTYEKWRYKSNPRFPSPEKVRDEIVQVVPVQTYRTVLKWTVLCCILFTGLSLEKTVFNESLDEL